MLVQSVLTGKARGVYSALSVEKFRLQFGREGNPAS